MKRLRLIIVIGLVAVACLGAGGYAYYHFLLRGPLAGDTSHDFGIMEIAGAPAERTHVFTLVNRLDAPITIGRVRPDCGCTQATLSRTDVPPGETVTITVTLALGIEGPKHARIALDLGPLGIENLHVYGTGRRVKALSPSPG